MTFLLLRRTPSRTCTGRGHTFQCGPGVQGQLEVKVLIHRNPPPEQAREEIGSARNSAGGPPQSAVGGHSRIDVRTTSKPSAVGQRTVPACGPPEAL